MDAQKSQSSWPSPSPDVAPLLTPDLVRVPPPVFSAAAPSVFIGAPTLPPAALQPYEPESAPAPIVTGAHEHTPHQGSGLIGTGATRVLAAAGWLGSVVGYTVAAVALSKSYRHITADNWRAAFDEIRWLLPLMISSFGMAYLGWVVWATLAAVNGHRVVPMASSPWLPPLAYLFGPVAAAAGSIYMPELNGYWLASAIVWVCIGHGIVLLSLRGSARRIGADAKQFGRLILFPLASLAYRIIATMVLPETSFNHTAWFTIVVAIDLILMMATASTVWRAMHSFDVACSRDRYSSAEDDLPAFMASANH